ncbi:hypothetical protein LJC45_02680 [Alistipes sp. OttesenSCG-928-B03]|nr:hypothetical protein [Alistipes sp. OttesenSCG-928-B03]
MLKFSASVIFLYQGHNFSFDMADFINAVDDWCQRLGVNLWQGDLDEFEFAAIMEVERPPKEYIAGHPDGYKLKSNPHPDENGYLRTYRDKLVLLKMYDVRRRIMTTIRRAGRGAVMQAGWRPERHYLKFEAHYLNPGNTFNNGRRMILADLIDPARVQQFKEDLCRQYKRLQPMKTLINPSDKKNLSTGEIILIELAEHYFNSGLSLQQVKKRLYARINAYPEPLMLPTDKNARKRKINEWLNKLTFEENSPFDLSGRLQEVLANTGECYPDRDY